MNAHRVWSRLFLGLSVLALFVSALPAAAAAWQPLPLWGGDVRLAAAADDPSVVYAVTRTAGFFRSIDRGETWQFVADFPNRLEVRAIAVDPHDEQRLFVTAWVPSPSFTYVGLFRSEDGGRHWQSVSLPPRVIVNDLAFDPETPGVVYAATSRGLFRSRNGGDTWVRIALTGTIEKVAVALSDPDVLLVSLVQESSRKTWRSTDGGETFTEVLARGTASFVFDPAQPQRVYGLDVTSVFVSDDLGASWTVNSSSGWSFRALVVLPSGVLLAGGYEQGVRRSTDDGATWVPESNEAGRPVDRINSLLVLGNRALASGVRGVWRSDSAGQGWRASSTGLRAHGITALEVGGDGTLWVGTQGGVFQGRDQGGRFQLLGVLGLNAYLQLLAVHPRESDVAYAFGCCGEGVGDMIKTEDGGATWQAIPYNGVTREPVVLEVDPTDPDIVYAGGFFAPHGGACTAVRSLDGGATWSCMLPLASRDFWALAIDPRQPRNLFASAGDQLFRSSDRGATWTQVPTQSRSFGRLEIDPFRSGRLFGVVGGTLFRSDNGGRTWNVKFPTGSAGFVRDILLDPQRKDRIWVAAQFSEVGSSHKSTSRIFRSDDAGEHWTEVSRGLRPGTVVAELAADPNDADVIYAGTEGRGLFRLRQ
jgi:photosystem II stability/assembly factor-like uncharacterized protein